MKSKTKFFVGLLLALFLAPLHTKAQYTFKFQSRNLNLEVLTENQFLAQYGSSPEIPKTDAEVIALAQKLYPPLGAEQPEVAAVEEECGTAEINTLFVALQNPAISYGTRHSVDQMITDSMPEFNRNRLFGHFWFHWTDNHDDYRHNVAESQIEYTAQFLNRYWDAYAEHFTEPLSDDTKMIIVYVYFFNAAGRASMKENYIELRSTVVQDRCLRRSVSAHELFHKVQYAYGYDSPRRKHRWLHEGTAKWAEKWTNRNLGYYLRAMARCLESPNKSLMDRTYDAGLFWTYLQQRGGLRAIREFFLKYQENSGLEDEDRRINKALEEVINERVDAPTEMTLDNFVHHWHAANYLKDFDDVLPIFDYTVGKTRVTNICGRSYGPLPRVEPNARRTIGRSSGRVIFGSVDRYAAKYYEFALDGSLTDLKISIDGDDQGVLSYGFFGIRGNEFMKYRMEQGPDCVFEKTLVPGELDKLVLVVGGGSRRGYYYIKIGTTDPCLTGTWQDDSGAVWRLEQYGHFIAGTVQTPSATCGEYLIYGKYAEPNTKIRATKYPRVEGCARKTTFTGTVSGCNSAGGTWTNTNGKSGSWSMTKQP